MDDVTQALVALTNEDVWVRFKSVEAILASATFWPVHEHVVCLLTWLSVPLGTWKAVLTVREDLLPWLRSHPRRRRIMMAAIRELVEAHHPAALLLSDGKRLSIMPLTAPIPTVPPTHAAHLLNGSALAAE